ncbi:hypothetical protein ACJZ2D_013502 [Fusarium nematophilum]
MSSTPVISSAGHGSIPSESEERRLWWKIDALEKEVEEALWREQEAKRREREMAVDLGRCEVELAEA